ncbi:hypothetical protein, partial [Burkholderia cenocepacia]|uniref:hypothetical protein n=1 Tax=Burkholderia cenocepacia TaxID=95486 RepID=UPI0024B7767C
FCAPVDTSPNTSSSATRPPSAWHGADGRCSEHTARMIDDEVRTLLTDAHVRVAATLGERRDALERIA